MKQVLLGALIFGLLLPAATIGQTDWKSFGNDPGHQRFSTLKQITPTNVTRLTRAWAYDTGLTGAWNSNPIIVNSVMYLPLPAGGGVAAVEPETGRELWRFKALTRGRVMRGVTYWPGDAENVPRILYAAGAYLVALDVKTGTPIPSFAQNGVLDVHPGMPDPDALAAATRAAGGAPAANDGRGAEGGGGRGGRGAPPPADDVPVFGTGPADGLFSMSSPAALFGNLAILGGSLAEEGIVGPPGNARAFDVRTGKLVWTFNGIPQPGEPNFGTWGDGWKNRGGPSLWGPITVDVESEMAFLPFGNPGGSFYGADRPGDNLYSESVVAVDAATGKYRWHYQVTRHDVWDFDLSAPPQLIDVVRNGRRIPAVAVISKNGFLFLLDRMTGKPIYPVEERPVPASEVPGEVVAKMQPFPTAPEPWIRSGMTRDEITTATPESNKFCTELWDREQIYSGGVYTSYKPEGVTVVFAGTGGGGNWSGGAFNPELGYYFVNTTNSGTLVKMVKGADGIYRNTMAYRRFSDQNGIPCVKPPYGELVAVNVNTGKVAWKIPLGNEERVAAKDDPPTGTVNRGGPTATASGLVFIAATRDQLLRAIDARTGQELWSANLGRAVTANPVTFMGQDGRQYVVVPGAGSGVTARDGSAGTTQQLLAFALPQPSK